MIPFLELTQLGKSYPGAREAAVIVKNFNLKLDEGEFVCIIGHSGCGKSTVLSIVYEAVPKRPVTVIVTVAERLVAFASPRMNARFGACVMMTG